MIKAIISLSGGIDSATVLAEALHAGRDCYAIGFTYGSKHNKYENEAARHVAHNYNVPFELIDLTAVMSSFQSSLLLTGDDIPEGHYSDASMASTVVPARNLIFASILAGLAASKGAQEIWLGIHAGDHAIYPDCRPEFFTALQQVIEKATDGAVAPIAPFLNVDKAAIVAEGIRLDVPYGKTRTCYKDQPVACGKCGSCVERQEAFRINLAHDPIEYEQGGDA